MMRFYAAIKKSSFTIFPLKKKRRAGRKETALFFFKEWDGVNNKEGIDLGKT